MKSVLVIKNSVSVCFTGLEMNESYLPYFITYHLILLSVFKILLKISEKTREIPVEFRNIIIDFGRMESLKGALEKLLENRMLLSSTL